jgi:hypothetical protein
MLKSRMNGVVTPLPHVVLQCIKYNWNFTFYNAYASAHKASRFRCLCVTYCRQCRGPCLNFHATKTDYRFTVITRRQPHELLLDAADFRGILHSGTEFYSRADSWRTIVGINMTQQTHPSACWWRVKNQSGRKYLNIFFGMSHSLILLFQRYLTVSLISKWCIRNTNVRLVCFIMASRFMQSI